MVWNVQKAVLNCNKNDQNFSQPCWNFLPFQQVEVVYGDLSLSFKKNHNKIKNRNKIQIENNRLLI